MSAPRQYQIFVNNEWKDAHSSTAIEFDDDKVRAAFPIRAEMPEPNCTFADHSARAFTRKQMIDYGNNCVNWLYWIITAASPLNQRS